MKRAVLIAVVFALGTLAGYLARDCRLQRGKPDLPRCVRVIDGDTITVLWHGETNAVRLVGIEAPEIRRGPKLQKQSSALNISPDAMLRLGNSARQYAQAVLVDQPVTLVFQNGTKPEHDSFGRLLAYVEYAGSDLGSELNENGYVWPRTEERHPRLEEYEAIGESARAAKRGLHGWVGR